jgi:hypothetical protein
LTAELEEFMKTHGPKIPLRPNAKRTHLIAETCLGAELVLEASGVRRTDRFKSSGGVIANGGLPAIPLRRKAS